MGLLDNQTAQDYYEGDSGGGYRFISLADIVNNFMYGYVGDGKIISHAERTDVIFHAKRGIQEFSFDISMVEKIQEVELSSSLSIKMPQDFVNQTKICWVDSSGIEHPMYEGRMTSKPSESVLQDSNLDYIFDGDGEVVSADSVTDKRFKEFDSDALSGFYNESNYYALNDHDIERTVSVGGRYGLDPELSQVNGWYIIDEANGLICFSSNVSGKIINIHYISDGLGTDEEMKVHKFCEEAIYMHIAYSILNTRMNVPEYQVNRFRKLRSTKMRNAKIRLSKLNPLELTQTMRGKSKRIK